MTEVVVERKLTPKLGFSSGRSVGAIREISSDKFLELQSALESNVRSYPRKFPITIAKAHGVYVEDSDGNKYLDCLAGAGALPLGYNHPEINAEIISKFSEQMPYQTLDMMTPTKSDFIQQLFAYLPPDFAGKSRIQFCGPSGSDAVEASIKLAKLATGRNTIVSFHGAYHGMTNGSMSLTGNLNAKSRRTNLMPDVHFFPYPYDFRCKFGLGGIEGERASIRYIESVLHDQESGIQKPAAIILEPIQGEGGVIPASNHWLQEIRRITSELGIVLIFDEIQCGVSRSGRNFAFEQSGVIPDVLILSKAIGGGFPLSCLVFNSDLDAWNAGEHTGTFRGNQIALAAGAKTLEILERDGISEHAKQMGNRLVAHLNEIKTNSPIIGDVRGRGLMLGVEFIQPGIKNSLGEPEYGAAFANAVQRECLKRGLIIEKGGRNGSVLRFLTPLIITPLQIDDIASIFSEAVYSVGRA